MEESNMKLHRSKRDKMKNKLKKLKCIGGCEPVEESFVAEYQGEGIDPNTTIIAFDLHHVLARPNKKKIAKVILKHPEKKLLVKSLQGSGFVKQIVLARIAGKDDTVPEKKMKDLTRSCEKDKDKERYEILNPLVTELCNSQDPDLSTFDLIKQLKSQNFGIYLLSNIGTDYFNELRNSWPEDLFACFDGFYTTNPDHGYVKKPSLEIFERFHQEFNAKGQRQVVFIDDCEENVVSARDRDMIGIVYKGAEQLSQEFQKLGIFVEHRLLN